MTDNLNSLYIDFCIFNSCTINNESGGGVIIMNYRVVYIFNSFFFNGTESFGGVISIFNGDYYCGFEFRYNYINNCSNSNGGGGINF